MHLVVVLQGKKFTKSVLSVQSCCFAYSVPIDFLPFSFSRLRRRRYKAVSKRAISDSSGASYWLR